MSKVRNCFYLYAKKIIYDYHVLLTIQITNIYKEIYVKIYSYFELINYFKLKKNFIYIFLFVYNFINFFLNVNKFDICCR